VSRPSIVIICGPTASGKSLLGLELAEALNGEIVSADSMQVYIHMDVGTDKPPVEVRKRIHHHMIDLVYPDQRFDAAQYGEGAVRAIRGISDSGKRAFLVGGTGLYIKALVHGLFSCPAIPREIRGQLQSDARERGVAYLYEELERIDPGSASTIHPNDAYRIIRALEVWRTVGKPVSELRQGHGFSQDRYRVLKIGIDMERKTLYRRIEARVDRMIDRGLVAEVERLFNLGYGQNLRPMQSIGYRQIGAYLHGDLSRDCAIELIKRDSRRYAKRQLTWFRGDSEIHWVAGSNSKGDVFTRVKNFLKV
jgi:tRNA dimethylallyltransferase